MQGKTTGIKVPDGGCVKCHEPAANTKTALAALGRNDCVEQITNFSVIAAYGAMSTPALGVNKKVVCYGKVLKPKEIKTIL